MEKRFIILSLVFILVSCGNPQSDWIYGYWQGTGEYEDWWLQITPDSVFGSWFTPSATDSETLTKWMNEVTDSFGCNCVIKEDGLYATGIEAEFYGRVIKIQGKTLILNNVFGNSDAFELKKRAKLLSDNTSFDSIDAKKARVWADVFNENGLAVYDTGLVHTDRLGSQSTLILVFRPYSFSADKTEGVVGLYKYYNREKKSVRYYQRYKYRYHNGRLCLYEGAVYNSSRYTWDTKSDLSREQCFTVDERDYSFSGDLLHQSIYALRTDIDVASFKGAFGNGALDQL